MDLNEILVFTRVVQAGSFTAGARRLGMPKSSVSRKVADLEQRIGARLLQRTTRKLGLTDAGRIYYERCARIISEVDEADRAVSRTQAAPFGLLRVTAPLSFDMIGPVISLFLSRHPEVQIELVCTDRRIDLVHENFDLAIRAGQLDDSTLVARCLGSIDWLLVASAGYLKRRGAPRTPAALTEHACITFGAVPSPGVWTLVTRPRADKGGGPSQSPLKKVEVRITPRLLANNFDLMCEAARAGLGIAWVPRLACAADLRAGRLVRVLPRWGSVPIPVSAVYPTARLLSPKVAAFLELLRTNLRLGVPSPKRRK